MKLSAILLVGQALGLLAGVGAAAGASAPFVGPPAPEPPPARVRWNNSESLTGEIAGGDSRHLVWKSPYFDEPLELAWPVLRRFDRNLPSASVAEAFAVSLQDGSQIFGDITSVTADTIGLRSQRHGETLIRRAELRSVRRINGGAVIWGGPRGDAGWLPGAGPGASASRNPRITRPVPTLGTGPGGSLLLPYWNTSAHMILKLPDAVEVDLAVGSGARPEFGLSVNGLRLETWDSELVLAMGQEYHFIRLIEENEKVISLKLLWDRSSRRCEVYTPGGRRITSWQIKGEVPQGDERIVLHNKGRNLVLDEFSIRKADPADLPGESDAGQPRTMLAGGRVVQGVPTALAGSLLTLASAEGAPAATAPLEDLVGIVASTAPYPKTEPPAQLRFADGTLLIGEIQAIQDGRVLLRTAFSEAPVAARLTGLEQILLNVPRTEGQPPETPFSVLDKLVVHGISLHGRMGASGSEKIQWQLIGAERFSSIAAGYGSEITLAVPPENLVTGSPALFYTKQGDVIPGRLVAMNRQGVELDSGIAGSLKLPAETVRAVQFNVTGMGEVRGFGDPGWRVLKGDDKSVIRKGDLLELGIGTAIVHPGVMQSSEIKFSMAATTFSTFRLRLFDAGDGQKTASNVIVAHFGSQIYSGMEADEGQLTDRRQTAIANSTPLVVRLVIQDKHVELFLNGVRAHRFTLDASRRPGMGLVIEPCSVWGNSVNPVKLSGFSSKFNPGVATMAEVSAEAKTQALTVPRFRKEDPPRHVLVAANGDVLRGEIEAITESHFGFRSGLENLKVPRDRVKAAVWLRKPVSEEEAKAGEADRTPELPQLSRPTSRRVTYSNAQLSTLINALKPDAEDVQFVLPERRENRSFRFQFGSQTVGEALEQICGLFGLRYRIEPGNKVVLEVPPPPGKGLVFRAYWVNSKSLPVAVSTQKLLEEHGLIFPEGSAAVLDRGAGLMTMTNTQAAHEALSGLLKEEWGGISGSPTHWLLLANGGRVGLTVEKFEQDVVRGHHPVYGACEVPRREIYTVCTTPPKESYAMKTLMDWQLVEAPEPVIADGAGNASPLVGKEAGQFKLDMVGGGNFDLSQERGKVVVLDFWATWCGPCIKALPGLMETMAAFPKDKVRLVGVNQGEPADRVKRFLEVRRWELPVALDLSQTVGRQYEVSGIPHTVVIGPDGKVAMVKTGYDPENDREIAALVTRLLATPQAGG